MDTSNEIHENDLGTEFILNFVDSDNDNAPIDISSQTLVQVRMIRHDKTVLTETATLTTDGTDGSIHYFSKVGDLTPIGNYKLQGLVTTHAGFWSSNIVKFKVHANL